MMILILEYSRERIVFSINIVLAIHVGKKVILTLTCCCKQNKRVEGVTDLNVKVKEWHFCKIENLHDFEAGKDFLKEHSINYKGKR